MGIFLSSPLPAFTPLVNLKMSENPMFCSWAIHFYSCIHNCVLQMLIGYSPDTLYAPDQYFKSTHLHTFNWNTSPLGSLKGISNSTYSNLKSLPCPLIFFSRAAHPNKVHRTPGQKPRGNPWHLLSLSSFWCNFQSFLNPLNISLTCQFIFITTVIDLIQVIITSSLKNFHSLSLLILIYSPSCNQSDTFNTQI